MDTRSVDCRKVADLEFVKEPGDFFIYGEDEKGAAWMVLCLPGEEKIDGAGGIQIFRHEILSHPGWHWDGNLDKPTLTPSIHHVGVWHGYMRAGRLESC